jgi:hypothetical protein
MASAGRSPAQTGAIAFELEQFDPSDPGRLLLRGRWFGVRGRRFVGPTLTLLVDGVRRRSLADLEHKPWAAEDGDVWEAAFPFEGSGVREAELAVAPGITVLLPAPADQLKKQTIAAQRSDGRPDVRQRRHGRLPQREDNELVDALAELGRLRDEVRGLREDLERDGALRARDQARVERDSGVRARDQARAERDDALKARDRAIVDRDKALAARTETARHRPVAPAIRDAAPPVIVRPRRNWPQRAAALIALALALLAILTVLRAL